MLSDLLVDNLFKNLRYKCPVRDWSVVLWFIWISVLFLQPGVMVAVFCVRGKQPSCREVLHMTQMNGRRTSTTSRRTDVGSGSSPQVLAGECSRTRWMSSADFTEANKLPSTVMSERWCLGGGASLVSARTTATLSVKNCARLSACQR